MNKYKHRRIKNGFPEMGDFFLIINPQPYLYPVIDCVSPIIINIFECIGFVFGGPIGAKDIHYCLKLIVGKIHIFYNDPVGLRQKTLNAAVLRSVFCLCALDELQNHVEVAVVIDSADEIRVYGLTGAVFREQRLQRRGIRVCTRIVAPV